MQRNNSTYTLLLAACFMLLGCAVSPAFASAQHTSYAAVGSAPPTFNFQTTSAYKANATGGAAYTQAIQTASGNSKQAYRPTQAFTVRLSDATYHSYGGGTQTGGEGAYSISSGSGASKGIRYSGGFASTSTYLPIVGRTTASQVAANTAADNVARISVRRGSNPWDEEPDDDPIGVVPTVPVP